MSICAIRTKIIKKWGRGGVLLEIANTQGRVKERSVLRYKVFIKALKLFYNKSAWRYLSFNQDLNKQGYEIS